MTTFAKESVTCECCRHVFTHQALSSTNEFGSPDLDTRPPEMKRSTMSAWIRRCPSCGYCSRYRTPYDAHFAAVVSSVPYRLQLADPSYPELAASFACAALLADAVGRQEDAAWAYLHAAWVLDDANKDELAGACRAKAADRFVTCAARGAAQAPQKGVPLAIAVDCLRRAGLAPQATRLIDSALSQTPEDIIQKVLMLQRTLIARGDTAAHLISEACQATQD